VPFERGATEALKAAIEEVLKTQFWEDAMAAERKTMRHNYEVAVKQAHTAAMAECARFVASLHPDTGAGGGSCGTSSGASTTEEAYKLKNALAELRSDSRPTLDAEGDVPFERGAAEALKAAIEDATALQAYATNRLEHMSLVVAPMSMAGTEYPVLMRPAVDLVSAMASQIWKQHGTPHNNLRFVLQEGGVLMNSSDLIFDYDLSSGISMVVLSDPVSEQLLRLTFDDPSDFALDSVSGLSGTWLYNRQSVKEVESFEKDGFQGVRIRSGCRLQLAQPVNLSGRWTLSVWTHTSSIWTDLYRCLVDGPSSCSRALLALKNEKIGYYCQEGHQVQKANFLRFTEREFDGWHHLAAVGAEGQITYYVRGQQVGSKDCTDVMLSGPICFVGNSADQGEFGLELAFDVMSDLRIYGTAAPPELIRILAEERAAP